ncbi:MAG: ParB/RepB/Spo0J family partition protein [Clostridia bacterium]|nr:ParB/RepB/Spo0J family partition protein [Clostridia bacterium]
MNNEENFIDELFGKTEETKHTTTEIVNMAVGSIVPNLKNPYKYREEDMKLLEDSIRENGIIQPIMVRKDDKADVFEIVSGHRRYLAATRLEMTEVPLVVLSISKEEADIILVDSNLHREHILPSEKAFAYKMKMDAIKKQGKRTDLTSDQVGPKLSAGEVSDTDSASQVKRYIRLTNLIPRLLALVDSGKIALGPAVELSYLSQGHQNFLAEAIEKELATPSFAQAQKLKKLEQEGNLDVGTILSMVKQQKPNQVVTVKIPDDKISKFLKPTATAKEKEDFLAKAVEYYGKHLMKQKDRGAR